MGDDDDNSDNDSDDEQKKPKKQVKVASWKDNWTKEKVKDRLSYVPVTVKGRQYWTWRFTPKEPVWRYEAVPHMIPEALAAFVNLRHLDLRENRIRSMPRFVGKLVSLTKLDLSFNNLHTLPNSIGALTSLEKLYLRANRLDVLPDSLGGSQWLDYVSETSSVSGYSGYSGSQYSDYSKGDDEYSASDVSGDEDDGASAVEAVASAGGSANNSDNEEGGDNDEAGENEDDDDDDNSDKSGNSDDDSADGSSASGSSSSSEGSVSWQDQHRTWVHGTWQEYAGKQDTAEYPGLFNLKHLDLFENRLTTLPTTIRGCTALEKLDASHNRLRSLPHELGKLKMLVELRVRDNHLRELPRGLAELDAGDKNSKEWMQPSFGLCILERQNNPMHTPPRSIPQTDVPKTLDYIGNPPRMRKGYCRKVDEALTQMNRLPINYDMNN